MVEKCDVLVAGTGAFAGRVIFDLAAGAEKPLTVAIGGRNPDRMDWLRTAANARAAIFGRQAAFSIAPINWETPESIAETIAATQPRVIVQAATLQPPSVAHAGDSEWSRMVMSGGLSITSVFQALLSARTAQAMRVAGVDAAFINCCYADVANGIIAAKGLPMTCGVGNVAILATMFEGDLGIRQPGHVKVLAHHHNLGTWRGPAAERGGIPPRTWINGKEIDDVYARFAHLRLTRESAIDISGCTAVPVIVALIGHQDRLCHVPGPDGLPGGYPVNIEGGVLSLDLPESVTRDEAIAWNRQFEDENGLVVEDDGQVVCNGRLRAQLAAHSPELAKGFHVDDLETAYVDLLELRRKLGG
ncbi:MAG: hypothetical protein QGI13_09430 [Rhodospirillales bacterium]|jgi:hypothetical protein|nr:hypothetical protein [Rhodospirillales bacterium]